MTENEDPAALAALRRPLSRQEGPPSSPRFLFLEGPCDSDCVFCRRKSGPATPWAIARRRLDQRVSGGRICLVGDELLAHPEILRIAGLCRELGFEAVEVMTSGLRFADPKFARDLASAGVSALSLPIHSGSREAHDWIVGRRDSHALAMRAVENALDLGLEVFLHANLLRRNLKTMGEWEERAAGGLRLAFAILPLRPKTSRLPYQELAVSIEEVRRAGLRRLAGFPLCAGGRGAVVSESLRAYLRAQALSKPPLCSGCRLRAGCPGIFPEQLELFGRGDLRPA